MAYIVETELYIPTSYVEGHFLVKDKWRLSVDNISAEE